ncbi:hypothetical protein [Pantoea eucrina]|uniref:hypothetical protein n=1 Tax=Pantoea eucrina TaxID=472693 RepID=UPI003CFA2A01
MKARFSVYSLFVPTNIIFNYTTSKKEINELLQMRYIELFFIFDSQSMVTLSYVYEDINSALSKCNNENKSYGSDSFSEDLITTDLVFKIQETELKIKAPSALIDQLSKVSHEQDTLNDINNIIKDFVDKKFYKPESSNKNYGI